MGRKEKKAKAADPSAEFFLDFLASKGLRMTHQRKAIIEAAYKHAEQFTAEELLDYSREIDRSVSRATVYRTLPILTECGLLKQIDVGRDYKFYLAAKGKTTEQAQVVCINCDKIYEIEAPFMEWYARSISQKVGMEPAKQRLQVHARCRSYQADGVCDRRESRG